VRQRLDGNSGVGRGWANFVSLNSRYRSKRESLVLIAPGRKVPARDEFMRRRVGRLNRGRRRVFAERYPFEMLVPIAGDLLDVLTNGFDGAVDGFNCVTSPPSVCFDFLSVPGKLGWVSLDRVRRNPSGSDSSRRLVDKSPLFCFFGHRRVRIRVSSSWDHWSAQSNSGKRTPGRSRGLPGTTRFIRGFGWRSEEVCGRTAGLGISRTG